MSDKTEDAMEFDYSEANSLFSDVVAISMSQENVVLGFAQRDISDGTKAKVLTKVYMTVPHFIRTLTVLGDAMQHLKDSGTVVEEKPDAER